MEREVWRLPVVEQKTGKSRSTIYLLEKEGGFPQRVRLGANSVGWYSDEITAWINARERGSLPAPQKAISARKSREKLAA